MTSHQTKINRELLDRPLENTLKEEAKLNGGRQVNISKLRNILMQMRKNCNHPDLITGEYDGSTSRPFRASRPHLAVLPEDLNDGLEGEPLWDVLPGPEHLPELRSGELLDGEALVRSDVGGDVALLLGVHDVQRRHGLDPELLAVGLGEVLGVVGAVKVLVIQAGLAAGHVPADDEV